jgi:hypothetical protein
MICSGHVLKSEDGPKHPQREQRVPKNNLSSCMKSPSRHADCFFHILQVGRLAFSTTMMTLLCQTALAGPLDVYRYEMRLIVISIPQTAGVEKVNSMLSSNREKIEERHLKIIDVSEEEQKISNAVRLDPSETEAVRKELRIGAGDTLPTFVLIGKDGGEAARCSGTLNLEKWFALIDEMPMRRAEILEQKNQRAEPPQN